MIEGRMGSCSIIGQFRLSVVLLLGVLVSRGSATPANKAALVKYYGQYLPTNLNSCATCHLPAKLDHPPESLDEFPHNPFGQRLRALGKELTRQGKSKDIATRLALIAREDTDADGVANEAELLLGHGPGDPKDKPTRRQLAALPERQAAFAKLLKTYRWEPFQSVKRPEVPTAVLSDLTTRRFHDSPSANQPRGNAASVFTRGKASPANSWCRNSIDAFIAAEHANRGLTPGAQASKSILLRRVYLDLIGLTPTIQEQQEFETDDSIDAYEKVVDRLLDDPRYGERWGRHWMDIWRYSDWAGWSDGNQIRDSKPHIWRWRDWIIESLNNDKGYDRMVLEMLAADELAPEDTNSLRATGFLVRNYKMLSREQWLEDTVKHTSQAFLGLTVGCAKCHNHMFDPIAQKEYYQMRAIFEPHQVRTDRLPGQLDINKDGLVRVFDTATNALTYLFIRGDERRPDTNQVMQPGVPAVLCSAPVAAAPGKLAIEPISLPKLAAHPDKRAFVIRDTLEAADRDLDAARKKYEETKAQASFATNLVAENRKFAQLESDLKVAESRADAIKAVLRAEKLEDAKGTGEWKQAAREAVTAQRKHTLAEAEQKLLLARTAEADAQSKLDTVKKAEADDKKKAKDAEKIAKDIESAKKKTSEAEKALTEAQTALKAEPSTAYKPRSTDDYPEASTGRRLAFARWLISRDNPLVARVAVNHIWLRHFGQGIVPTPNDFGANGRPPSHPALLDWLAAEFMANHWSMKKIHRLILTSSTYRMASTPDAANAAIDQDNLYLWRMPSRRMEAELVRDNLLHIAGNLDLAMGGPEIDHKLGLSSKRRSVYLRTAAEKEVEFLKLFDNASVTECYMRKPSVMPQQALALANSELAINQAQILTEKLLRQTAGNPEEFIAMAFRQILARPPKLDEARLCREFLANRPKAQTSATVLSLVPVSTTPVSATVPATDTKRFLDVVLVLFNHNDFVSIR